jgi:hypothetical protein
MDDLTVTDAELGPRDRINAGANGIIWSLRTFRLETDPGPLVFKEYQGAALDVSLPGLRSIVNARVRLTEAKRAQLDQLTVWPLRAVINGDGQPVGVLMHLIDSSFMQRMKLPSGSFDMTVREVQHLIYDAGTARRGGIDVPADRDTRTRLMVCERMAFTLNLLHDANLVYGDLSARNVLYRMRPTPSVMLVDCDAARVRGSAAIVDQQNSPDWNPPEGSRQTQDTDRYKLALFVLRCLSPGRGSSINRDPGSAPDHVDDDGRRLLRSGLSGVPEERPRASEWLDYLRRQLGLPTLPTQASTAARETYERGWRRGEDGVWIRA